MERYGFSFELGERAAIISNWIGSNIKKKSFDVVILGEVLWHSIFSDILFAEVERVLKPHGLLISNVEFSMSNFQVLK